MCVFVCIVPKKWKRCMNALLSANNWRSFEKFVDLWCEFSKFSSTYDGILIVVALKSDKLSNSKAKKVWFLLNLSQSNQGYQLDKPFLEVATINDELFRPVQFTFVPHVDQS